MPSCFDAADIVVSNLQSKTMYTSCHTRFLSTGQLSELQPDEHNVSLECENLTFTAKMEKLDCMVCLSVLKKQVLEHILFL